MKERITNQVRYITQDGDIGTMDALETYINGVTMHQISKSGCKKAIQFLKANKIEFIEEPCEAINGNSISDEEFKDALARKEKPKNFFSVGDLVDLKAEIKLDF